MKESRQRRRRWSHKSKSVSTTDEVVLQWVLKAVYVGAAILAAVAITVVISRR
jgi:hypothetical protein